MKNYDILIPVYNDWKSLNKLLTKIDSNLKGLKGNVRVLVINDKSTEKPFFEIKKIKMISKISVLNLKKNFGSQGAIAIALNYISQSKKESIISIIDADGEDDPNELKKMIKFAIKYPKNIIVSNRTKRSEVFIFKVLYKIHLIITLLLTNKWISFGNFSSFNSRNLKNLLKNNYIWFSYSSAVVKNCLIKNLYAARKKRYFGNSKVSFFKLFLHSLKILSVFQLKIILNTIFIVFLLSIISLFYDLFFIKLVTYFLLIINFLVLIIRMSFLFEKEKYKINQINNIKIIK